MARVSRLMIEKHRVPGIDLGSALIDHAKLPRTAEDVSGQCSALPGVEAARRGRPRVRAADQTEIRLRPFALRRLRTSFPARVLIRFRKPWTRERL